MGQRILFTILAIILSLPVIARDFEYSYEGQTIKYTVIDEEAKTCKTKDNGAGNQLVGRLILPSNPKDDADEYNLVTIGYRSFWQCSHLTSVIIPNSVTSIERAAFYKCDSLISVKMPESLKSIERSTFNDCKNLSSIDIPHSVTSIKISAFENCRKLVSIELPISVDTIWSSAFKNCSNLSNLHLPNSIKTIGSEAFYGCSSLTSLVLPDSISQIKADTFTGCKSLTSIEIPNSITSIGANAFNGCSALTSITIPNSVISIGRNAFWYCIGLTSVILPNSITEIGSNAFVGCSGLIKSAYPNTLVEKPFHQGIAVPYEPHGSIIEDGYIYNHDKSSLYFVPYTVSGTFCIPESITTIENSAFNGCRDLNAVIIPNSVVSIGNEAFYGCENLDSLIIPNSVKTIGYFAFAQCDHLTSVEIGNSVATIGDYAFWDCCNLTSVIIPYSITDIGKNVFKDNISLIKGAYPLTIENPFPTNCIGIPYDAFDSKITDGFIFSRRGNKLYYAPLNIGREYEVPESVVEITDNAFAASHDLETIILNENLSTIGNSVWRDCDKITQVVCKSNEPSMAAIDIFGMKIYDDAVLYVPQNCIQKYAAVDPWGYFYNITDSEFNNVDNVSIDRISKIDYSKPYEIYNMCGVKVAESKDSIVSGVYVVKQGNVTIKIAVK